MSETHRIIFVGICNKPGLSPLDSTTRSGRRIDSIINSSSLKNYLKTNLHDTDSLAEAMSQDLIYSVFKWAERVEYNGNDIVICLGSHVKGAFYKFKKIPFKFLPHPSAQWSNDAKVNYLKRGIDIIMAACAP
jgi:hypothetical protein